MTTTTLEHRTDAHPTTTTTTSPRRTTRRAAVLALGSALLVGCAQTAEDTGAATDPLTLATTTTTTTSTYLLTLPCGAITGYCVTDLGAPAPAPIGGRIATDGTAVLYVAQPASTTVAAARFDVSTRRVSLSNALALGAVSSVYNLAVDPYGRVWAGLGSRGNARFGFGYLASQGFDAGEVGLGAVTAGFSVARLTNGGILSGTSSTPTPYPWNPPAEIEVSATAVATTSGEITVSAGATTTSGEITVPPDAVATSTGEISVPPTDSAPVGASVAATLSGGLAFWTPNGTTIDRYDAPSFGRIAAPVASGYTVGHSRAIATSALGQVAVVADSGEVLARDRDGGFSLRVRVSASDVAFAGETLYIASARSPVIYRVAPGSTTATTWRLSNATAGTTEYTNAIPRALVALDDGSVIALTDSRELYRVAAVN